MAHFHRRFLRGVFCNQSGVFVRASVPASSASVEDAATASAKLRAGEVVRGSRLSRAAGKSAGGSYA